MLDRQSIDFITYFLKAYPRRTAFMTGFLSLASFAEGFGIIMLLPLLEISMNAETGNTSELSSIVVRFLHFFDLQPTLGVLLTLIVISMTLKGIILWLTMKQVGYAVAQVATNLRLRLIRALMEANWGYFTTQPVGHFANAISTEAHRTSLAYREACSALACLIQVAIYLILLFLVSWQASLLALIMGGGVMFTLGHLVSVTRNSGKQQTAVMKSLMARLTEMLLGIKSVKSMARERELWPLLEQEAEIFKKTQFLAVSASESLRSFYNPIIASFIALGLYLAITYSNMTFSSVLPDPEGPIIATNLPEGIIKETLVSTRVSP